MPEARTNPSSRRQSSSAPANWVYPETRLRCPACRHSLKPGPTEQELPGGYGVLACSCRRHPVVEAIPIVKEDTRPLLQALDRGDWQEAFFAACDFRPCMPVVSRALKRAFPPSRPLLAAWERSRRRKELSAFRDAATFFEASQIFFGRSARGNWATAFYFLLRQCDPTYLAARSLLPAVLETGGPLLDACCGTGHFTRLAGNFLGPGNVIGLERSFERLFLAKRFVFPEGSFVCADAGDPLPFQENAFQSTICVDALSDLDRADDLVKELTRITHRQGPILLSHLHNPHAVQPYQGRNPQEPDFYRRHLGSGRRSIVFPDSRLLALFLEGVPPDLESGPREQIETAEWSYSILSLGQEARTRPAAAPVRSVSPSRWRLNPYYLVVRRSAGLLLKRRKLPERYLQEYPQMETYLPATVPIASEWVPALRRGECPPGQEFLLERFILIDLPERFVQPERF